MTELLEEIGKLYASLKEALPKEPRLLLDELDYRCAWLARSAEIRADAQRILDQKKGNIAEQWANRPPEDRIAPSALKEIIAGKCSEEQRLVNLADKLNSTLVHQIDAIRSIVSFEKSMFTVR